MSATRKIRGPYAVLSDAFSHLGRRSWAFLLLLLFPLTYLVLMYAVPVLLLIGRSLLSYDVATQVNRTALIEKSSEIDGSATLIAETMNGVRNELSITTARTYRLSVGPSSRLMDDATNTVASSLVSIVRH